MDRVELAKGSYSTRLVQLGEAAGLTRHEVHPQPGDVLLARVTEVGEHRYLERPDGRLANLFDDDEVLLCYGEHEQAQVPDDLGPCQLVAAGGVAARTEREGTKARTSLVPLGLLVDEEGQVLNLRRWAMRMPVPYPSRPVTLVITGTGAGTGKTSAAAALIRGLNKAGFQVGAAKVTGTGMGVETWVMRDAGAKTVLDMTDAGLASTYRASLPTLVRTFELLVAQLAATGVGVVVVELAEGIPQAETGALLATPDFAHCVDGVLVAAHDAVGAGSGVARLRTWDLPVIGVTGRLTRSTATAGQAAQLTDLPVLTLADLRGPETAGSLAKPLAR
ncbi:DUF1611 domain-containing protein [Kutzneria viridogrisea]